MNPPRLIRLACGVFKLGRYDIIRTDLHRWEVRDRRIQPPARRVVAVCPGSVEAIDWVCNVDVERPQCSSESPAGVSVGSQ